MELTVGALMQIRTCMIIAVAILIAVIMRNPETQSLHVCITFKFYRYQKRALKISGCILKL